MNEESSAYIYEIGGDVKGIVGEIKGGVVNQYIIASQSEAEIRSLTLIKGSPYMGLNKFEPRDKDKFFGREQWIIKLSNHLEVNNLLFLLGASGSGKSSLVQAGLIPHLSDQWGAARVVTLIFVPDKNPFESLYDSLPRKYKAEAAEIIEEKKPGTLVKLVKNLKEDSHKWLVFIDQFEELFTITPKLECDKFIASLVQLIKQQDSSVKLVMAMRSDLIDNLSDYADLTNEVVNSKIQLVTELTEIELRLAIAEPAARNGVTFEKGLVEQIVSDFNQQAGSLPLLQYTLDLLWEKNDISEEHRVLNIETYQDLGGVSGALQQQANYIYDKKLNGEEKKAVEKIFINLIDISEREPVSRRAELSIFQEEKVVKSTLNKLIDNRLLVSGRYKSTVEVAHEELLRSWEFVQDLIREKEEIIILKSRLISDAQQWYELKKENEEKAKDELWSGSKLERVRELIEKKTFTLLDEQSEQFIQASVEWRDRVRAEKIRLQRRAIKWLSGGLAAALVATVIATWQWQRSERQTTLATLRENAVRVKNRLTSNFSKVDGLALAIAATGKSQDKLGKVIPAVESSLLESIQTVRERERLIGHTSYDESGYTYSSLGFHVQSVAFSPDGQYIVSCSQDTTVRLWDREGNLVGQPFTGHKNDVNSVAFSPDGQYIVSGGGDQTVRVWDREGNPVGQPFRGHTDRVYSVAFSPDGQYIVSGGGDQTVRLWDRQGNLVGQPFTGHEDGVTSVALSPDGQYLVSGSWDETIRVWDRQGNPVGQPFTGHKNDVNSVAFSPDGQYIVSGGWDGTVRLWDRRGNLVGQPFRGHTDRVYSVAFSPDGQYIVSGGWDGTVRLWDRRGNLVGQPFTGHEDEVISVGFSPDGQYLVSGSHDNTIRVWDREVNPVGQPFTGHRGEVNSVAFSPDGQYIFSGEGEIVSFEGSSGSDGDGTVRVWDRQGNPVGQLFISHKNDVNSVALSPDGQYLVSGSDGTTVRVWDRQGNPVGQPFIGHTGWVYSVAFSPDGQYIVSGSGHWNGDDNTVRVWDREGNPVGQPFRGHTGSVYSVAFSPDGQYIVSGGRDQTVRLWDRQGNLVGQPFAGHTGSVYSVAFSPDGQYIVSGSQDQTVRVWDREGHLVGQPFTGHRGGVSSVGFSPDGQYLVSGSHDNTIRVWDRQGNSVGQPFTGHTGRVSSLAFSPDGQYIVSGSEDKTVRVWKFRWQNWLRIGCNRLRFHPVMVNPQTESAKLAAETCLQSGGWSDEEKAQFLIHQGKASAREGKVQEAIIAYKFAQQLNPEIDLNPETKNIDKDPKAVAVEWAALAKVKEGERLAQEGKVEDAIAAYNSAQQLNPN